MLQTESPNSPRDFSLGRVISEEESVGANLLFGFFPSYSGTGIGQIAGLAFPNYFNHGRMIRKAMLIFRDGVPNCPD